MEDWVFDRISTGTDLTKMEKILYYLKMCYENIFCQSIISTHQRKCFSSILGNFWKMDFLTWYRQASPSQKWWKFCNISKCVKKIFFVKIIISTHQRKCFSTIKDNFWKIEFWWKSTGATLTKVVKILYYLKMCLEFFLSKLFYPLIKKVFLHNFRQFLKIEFWRNIYRRRPYENG